MMWINFRSKHIKNKIFCILRHFSNSYKLKKHVADNIKVSVPKSDDNTDWIKPEYSEYFQIRKRIRLERDKHFEESFLYATENEVFNFLDKSGWKSSGEIKITDRDSFSSKMLYGESKDDKFSKKTLTWEKRLNNTVWGCHEPYLTVKARRQLEKLEPYLGVNRVNDFLYEMTSSVIASVCRTEEMKIAYNKRLSEKQKILIEKFENDSNNLIDEAENLKNIIVKNENNINSFKIQQTLRQWAILINDFSDENIKQGRLLAEQKENEIEKEKEKEKNEDEDIDLEKEKMKEVVTEKVDLINQSDPLENIKKKISTEMENNPMGLISLDEAKELLSDNSIIELIENMRFVLEEAHDLLKQQIEVDDKENFENDIKEYFWNETMIYEKEIYLDKIKNSRFYDLAVRIRGVLDNPNATKEQRLKRKLYDKIKAQLFEDKENHFLTVCSSIEDYPNLEKYKNKILIRSKSVFELNCKENLLKHKINERNVNLEVELDEEDQKLIKLLFPKNLSKTKLFIKVDEFNCKELNKKKALEILSKIIYEKDLYKKLNYPKTLKDYSIRLNELKKSNNFIDYKQFSYSKMRFNAERKIQSEINYNLINNVINNILINPQINGTNSNSDNINVIKNWKNSISKRFILKKSCLN